MKNTLIYKGSTFEKIKLFFFGIDRSRKCLFTLNPSLNGVLSLIWKKKFSFILCYSLWVAMSWNINGKHWDLDHDEVQQFQTGRCSVVTILTHSQNNYTNTQWYQWIGLVALWVHYRSCNKTRNGTFKLQVTNKSVSDAYFQICCCCFCSSF